MHRNTNLACSRDSVPLVGWGHRELVRQWHPMRFAGSMSSTEKGHSGPRRKTGVYPKCNATSWKRLSLMRITFFKVVLTALWRMGYRRARVEKGRPSWEVAEIVLVRHAGDLDRNSRVFKFSVNESNYLALTFNI